MEDYISTLFILRQCRIQKKITIFAVCVKMVFVFYANSCQILKFPLDERLKTRYTRIQSE